MPRSWLQHRLWRLLPPPKPLQYGWQWSPLERCQPMTPEEWKARLAREKAWLQARRKQARG